MTRIPLTPSQGEEKDLASSFEAELLPLDEVEQFKSIYDEFKKRHPKADHYPYSYRVRALTKSSDDGEPGGSAGRPMLSLLEEKDIDGLLIVARYFGGSKLGIPRLRRAFLASANKAIEAGRFGVLVPRYEYEVEIDYSTFEILKSNANRHHFSLEDVIFDVKVHAKIHSGATLERLGEKIGLPMLDLGAPKQVTILEEIPNDPH